MLLSACSDLDESPVVPELESSEIQQEELVVDSIYVNEVEANHVADLYIPSSRSGNRETRLVNDRNGDAGFYIINNIQSPGFVLVSAKKTFQPVLAYSETGHFEIPTGIPYLDEWISNALECVSSSNHSESRNTAINEWRRFENHLPVSGIHASRAIDYDEYTELRTIFEDSINSWRSRGYEVYRLDEYRFRDEQQRMEVYSSAEGSMYPQYIEDFELLSFIVKEYKSIRGGTQIEINYPWRQEYPFNQAFPILSNGYHAYVGCSAVAAGLIMKYYQHPTTYNWNLIPTDGKTKETSELLYDIASNSNPTYKLHATSISLKDLCETIGKRGYSKASKTSFNLATADSQLDSRKPIIVGSLWINSIGVEERHAWVCSGTSIIQTEEQIMLWTFSDRRQLNRIGQIYSTASGGFKFYYVNFGWGTSINGYYSNLFTIGPEGSTSHSLKEMIINIQPSR